MKCLVISNVITNGGDFLILDSSLKLIRGFLGEENCVYVNSSQADIQSLDLEPYDTAIYAGGPLYTNRLLENAVYPLMERLMEEEKKIFLLGCGWYGQDDSPEKIYGYRFSKKAKRILSYVDKHGILGCRDYLTVSVLKNNGYGHPMMTGCPVWYDGMGAPEKPAGEIKKVAVSDMGMTKDSAFYDDKFRQFTDVLEFVQKRFPQAEVIFTFNNGILTKYSSVFNQRVQGLLDGKGIKYYDLSGSRSMFSVYDDCDFHIGYRVHSHIYSLTRGIPSVLVCEDARGMGMNRTLGFPVIRANAAAMEGAYQNNPFLVRQLEDGTDRILENSEYEMRRARELFRHYYGRLALKYFGSFDVHGQNH